MELNRIGFFRVERAVVVDVNVETAARTVGDGRWELRVGLTARGRRRVDEGFGVGSIEDFFAEGGCWFLCGRVVSKTKMGMLLLTLIAALDHGSRREAKERCSWKDPPWQCFGWCSMNME